MRTASADTEKTTAGRSSKPQPAPDGRLAPPAPALGNQATLRVMRKCDCDAPDCDCDMGDDKKKKETNSPRTALHRAALSPRTPREAPPIVHEALRSTGHTLDPETQAFFEARFGQELSHVCVHTDARASESARAVNALAYTVGRDIVFAPGRFAPGASEGRRLLAHELAHVVQQPNAAERISDPSEPLEQNADRMANEVMRAPAPAVPAVQPFGSVGQAQSAREIRAPAPHRNQAALRRLSTTPPKLEIGAVDDPFEHEADAVAEQVMRMPDPADSLAQAPPAVSGKCATCEEENKLQTKLANTPLAAGGAPERAAAAEAAPGITASPVKVFRDNDPDVVPAQTLDAKNDWTPPPPPTPGPANQVKAIDPRVFHDGKPPKFPGNPPPPSGWRYFNEAKDGQPPPRGVALCNECLLPATPIGTFVQEIVDGRLIAVRCEWHDRHKNQTDPSGVYKSGNIMLPVGTQKSVIQNKLAVSTPGDPLEREADRVAEMVTMANGETHESELAREPRSGQVDTAGTPAPPSVTAALGARGEPLEPSLRAYFEPRFGRDFSQVRLHTDGVAAHAARSIQAGAFASGGDIVFAAGEYAPATAQGRRLIAHELAHVVQQGAAASSNSVEPSRVDKAPGTPVTEQKDIPPDFIARQNTSQTANVLSKGTTPGSGVEFWPMQITSTSIGPVTGAGGLAATPNRVSAIVGQKMTLNALARLILRLWNSAAPFTPEGATTPLVTADLTADQLARGLLVYNQSFLRVLSQPASSMTGFASGLRLPLPVEIDASGKGVVNKDLINNLAAGFDSGWAPLLDQPATVTVAPGTADLRQTVADFLVSNSTGVARGIALATRAISNATEARPFVLEAFRQLDTGKFDVALAFMDNLVNSEIGLLASQRDGAAILDSIRAATAAPPATLSDAQQASLSRANLMLGSAAAIAPRAPPAARTASIKDVDFTLYAGGGDIDAWIAQACQAAGVPVNDNWVNGLRTLSNRESRDDPNAVNTWDVNATGPTVGDGHPQNCSRGLAQVIPPTFLTFHAAGTSWSIYDAAANIAAAIGYIRNRYHVSLDGSNLAANVQQADPTRAPAGY